MPGGPRRPQPDDQRGFTLLEVLIAMAVLALTLGAAVGAVTGSADRVARVEERTYGFWVASNVLVGLQMQVAPALPGSFFGEEEMAGRTFHWRVDIVATPDSYTYRVDVTVHRDASGSETLAALTGFLPAPEAPGGIPGP
jgi:general secretion pathway protein I